MYELYCSAKGAMKTKKQQLDMLFTERDVPSVTSSFFYKFIFLETQYSLVPRKDPFSFPKQ